MDVTCFHERADSFLQDLVDALETADENSTLDVELHEGILTIQLEDNSEYVLNKHEPTSRIWMSSPESGASRYNYDEGDDEWRDSNSNILKEIISEEMAGRAGIDVEF